MAPPYASRFPRTHTEARDTERSRGSPAGGSTRHGNHRILLILDPFGEAVGFDLREPGMAQIALDQRRMAVIVEPVPDRHRLRRKAAVREADDDGSAGAQHPRDLAQHRDRLLE